MAQHQGNPADNQSFWEKVLVAFLHDPPDKALDIRGHEERAARYLEVLTRGTTRQFVKDTAAAYDQLAAASERLPMPPKEAKVYVNPVDGKLRRIHPLSAVSSDIPAPKLDEETVKSVFAAMDSADKDLKALFFKLWRELPKDLGDLSQLPADTREPGHTIWHHCDMAAAFAAAKNSGVDSRSALLHFDLGPVQKFIEASRPLRDLWTSSFILSWLTFHGMMPIVKKLGPTAVISPALRGNPLVDWWLATEMGIGKSPDKESLATAALPNVFVALVPLSCSRELSALCKEAVATAWKGLADSVRNYLRKAGFFEGLPTTAAQNWDMQVESFFEVSVAILPYEDSSFSGSADDNSQKALAGLAKLLGAGFDYKGLWPKNSDTLGKLAAASRIVRHVPAYTPVPDGDHFPHKCTLLGTYEQIGPANFEAASEFWKKVAANGRLRHRTSTSDRLSAPALVKRFAYDAFFDTEVFGRGKTRLESIPDTATLAAIDWLDKLDAKPWEEKKELGAWNGQWLHWSRSRDAFLKRLKDDDGIEGKEADDIFEELESIHQTRKQLDKTKPEEDKLGDPPIYYALIVLDGDNMGKWLTGVMGPSVWDSYHPDIQSFILQQAKGKPDALKLVDDLKKVVRPVSPARQAAISEALTNFAVYSVPEIVDKHKGFLVYSGGDDVLALVPVMNGLACAMELSAAFSGDKLGLHNGRLAMGNTATVSAGLAVVHYKEHMAFALEIARKAENAAKIGGRNSLGLTIVCGSGETSQLLPWTLVPTFQKYLDAFRKGASDRWAYRLAEAVAPLLPQRESEKSDFGDNASEVATTILSAFVRKMESQQKDKFSAIFEADPKMLPNEISKHLEQYSGVRKDALNEKNKSEGEDKKLNPYVVLNDFVALVKAASFMARGRDR